MSVYDRGYMNAGEESALYAGRKYAAVVVLIAINVAVWVLWLFAVNGSSPALTGFMHRNFLVSADGVLHRYYVHTLLTSEFSHIEPSHIFFNMLFLWFLGEDVERIYGYRNFFVLYAFAGILASVGHVALGVLTGVPEMPALGASGAVMGIAVVAALFDPNRPMLVFGVIPTRLKWLVLFYIATDLIGVVKTGNSPIAHAAHLGGAMGGLLFWKLDLRLFPSPGRTRVGWFHRLKHWLDVRLERKPPLQIVERSQPRERVASRSAHAAMGSAGAAASPAESSPGRSVDAATSRRVDELLGKISSQGIGALTEEERAFLKQSSEKYKKN